MKKGEKNKKKYIKILENYSINQSYQKIKKIH